MILSVVLLTGESVARPEVVPVALVASASRNPYLGQFCGGTLIARQVVLTAAHCVRGRSVDSFEVLLGEDNLCSEPVTVNRLAVAEVTFAPAVKQSITPSDVALLWLRMAVDMPTVPVSPHFPEAGEHGVVRGWGGVGVGSGASCRQQPKRVSISDSAVCVALSNKRGRPRRFDPQVEACATPDGKADTCPGDSGAALLVRGSVVAIVSWGFGCGLEEASAYATAAPIIEWIDTCTHSLERCVAD